jgi:lipoprotein-releasing system permease protein
VKFQLWLAYRLLVAQKSRLFRWTGLISLAGLILGVACLMVSMAVMSGFETTLQTSVANITGHVQVAIRGITDDSVEDFREKIKKITPDLQAITPFSYLEGVLGHEGKLSGVILQGVDPATVLTVLGLDQRVVEGKFDLSPVTGGSNSDFDLEPTEVIPAMIGKDLAKNFSLKVGSRFKIVLPLHSDYDPSQFRRKVATVEVRGVLDLGKYEYNQRMLIVPLADTQKLAEIGDKFSGVLLRYPDIDDARARAASLVRGMGAAFSIRDWHDMNENLFEAVKIERVTIFFVILVIVLAAAFNVSSTLYINVVKRFPEIGILKSFGLSKRQLIQIFSLQGLMIGGLGLLVGVVLGFFLCQAFGWLEVNYGLIPGSIYKVDRIDLNVRFVDLFFIAVATLSISFVATLAPAFRGAKLSPVEGLRHD